MIETKELALPRAVFVVRPHLAGLLPTLCLALGCTASWNDNAQENAENAALAASQSSSPPLLPAVLKNANNGLYLDVSQVSTATGAQVWAWSFTGAANQEWQFTPMGNGWYEIVSRNSGKCLDVNANSTTDGQTLQQWDCNGGTNQLFSLQTLDGNVQIVGQGSGKCLQSSNQGNGTSVVIWDCGTATSQQWSVTVAPSNVSVPTGSATLKNAANTRMLDVSSVSKTNGAQVWTWSATGGANQLWSFQSMGDGSYELVSQNSSLCLDVAGNSTTTGQTLEQWTCNGGPNQRYYLYTLGSKVQIAEQGAGKCLSSSQQSDGSPVTIQPCSLTDPAQQWSISGGAPVSGACDIYASGGTPCVAAFSTVRALYGSYTGKLYQVRRADNGTRDIGVLAAGGVADAAAQDTFCSGTTCTISIIYDQSGKGNDLTKAPGGSAVYGPNPDAEAVADALPITIGGHKAYGVHVTPAPSWTSPGQVGYRNTNTTGIATGDQPESIYMVTDGTYYNGSCCFDFGNSEMTASAGGYGSMEAIYFGSNNWWDKGNGDGPWIMADLEVGVYSMGGPNAYSDANTGGNRVNDNSLSLPYPFVTAMLKGNSANATTGGPFTLKGGNAQSGTLTVMWDGARPVGYSTMHKDGGIVLGVGGDNSSTAQGNFYEGVMTSGYASTATDNAVQANIVAAGYGR